MLIVFFDIRGLVHHEFIPTGQKSPRNTIWTFRSVCVRKEVHNLVISMADSKKGYKNNQIADLINISESCVKVSSENTIVALNTNQLPKKEKRLVKGEMRHFPQWNKIYIR